MIKRTLWLCVLWFAVFGAAIFLAITSAPGCAAIDPTAPGDERVKWVERVNFYLAKADVIRKALETAPAGSDVFIDLSRQLAWANWLVDLYRGLLAEPTTRTVFAAERDASRRTATFDRPAHQPPPGPAPEWVKPDDRAGALRSAKKSG